MDTLRRFKPSPTLLLEISIYVLSAWALEVLRRRVPKEDQL